MNSEETESRYLQYLPSIYQAKDESSSAFLGRFLKAFEKILSGIDDNVNALDKKVEGIGQKLDTIYDYFDPEKVDRDFLPWLAGWVALPLKEGEGWDDKNQRKLIARIVPLYRKRGTLEGLKEYIRIYVGEDVPITIKEFLNPIQLNITSTIGKDTQVGDGPPYYFQVHMDLPEPDWKLLIKKRDQLKDIIDQEKPAHTNYDLIIKVPTMQVAVYSTVGENTLIGGIISE